MLHSLIHSFIHSFNHSIIHSFTHSLIQSGGTLHSSLTEQVVNGKRREQTITTRLSSRHYRFDQAEKSGEKRKWEVMVPIAHTITGLYYQEPAQVQDVYSEKYGAMCKVKKLGNGSYSVSLPNGKQSIYSYVRGECVRVVTSSPGCGSALSESSARFKYAFFLTRIICERRLRVVASVRIVLLIPFCSSG